MLEVEPLDRKQVHMYGLVSQAAQHSEEHLVVDEQPFTATGPSCMSTKNGRLRASHHFCQPEFYVM